MPILNPDERSSYRFSAFEPEPEIAAPPPTVIRWDLIAGGIAIVALVGWLGFRVLTSERTESIHRIRNHAAAFDGRTVAIRGTVGDVFDVGSSRTYLLHQGRDTIVVFTRGAAPQSGSTVTVHGSVSVGYLDGSPHPALFEIPAAR